MTVSCSHMTTSNVSDIVRALVDRADSHATNLGQGLIRLAVAVDAAYARASRELDLTAQQAHLLCAIGLAAAEDGRPIAASRPTPIGAIAAELHCDQSNASHLVDRAAKRGLLVRRRGAAGDARVTLVELTDEGERQLDRFLNVLLEAIEPMFSDWELERKAAALEVLNSLADNLEDAASASARQAAA
jgi:DNA-binding MarR family transcriptional regulator